MKTLRISGKNQFGVIIDKGARKYLSYSLNGVKKVLIVSDETVFKLYGNGMTKLVKSSGAEAYTFIYPAGENGKSKLVLDKLIILMTELKLDSGDCLVAFGGKSVYSLTAFASAVFKGCVPFIYVPTTLQAMVDSAINVKVGVDFIGKKDLLVTESSPMAVFSDVEYLNTLPELYMQDGYAEIIRILMITDKDTICKMESQDVEIAELVFKAVKGKLKLTETGVISKLCRYREKSNFALKFGAVAERVGGLNLPYGRLVAFGIMTAVDTAMALGVSGDIEQRVLNLFKKYNVQWDVGVSSKKLWQGLLDGEKDKIRLVLPTSLGKCKIKKITKDKIKETF